MLNILRLISVITFVENSIFVFWVKGFGNADKLFSNLNLISLISVIMFGAPGVGLFVISQISLSNFE
ncbi:MAG: hypothetical protein H6613_09485 [Ignavibacteriales bacterium]|nr:hypothetical protein [Ignavibacteriales bacterium]